MPPRVGPCHGLAHHGPDQCGQSCQLSDLVHVANIAVRGLDRGTDANHPLAAATLKAIDRLGLRPDDLAAPAEQTLQEMGKLGEILNG